MQDYVIKFQDLPSVVGLGRSAIKDAIESGTFPKPIKLTDSKRPATGWLASEVQEWIKDRALRRDQEV